MVHDIILISLLSLQVSKDSAEDRRYPGLTFTPGIHNPITQNRTTVSADLVRQYSQQDKTEFNLTRSPFEYSSMMLGGSVLQFGHRCLTFKFGMTGWPNLG
jgi:hypothetical protein